MTPPEPRCAGRTTRSCVPIAEMLLSTWAFAPAAMASMAMTAPTPMIMPSTARNERNLFPRRLNTATLSKVMKYMPARPYRFDTRPSRIMMARRQRAATSGS